MNDEQEARRILDRVDREGDVLGSALRRTADHFAAREADPADRIELWGRRIGRGLSLVGVIVLAILLVRQLGAR
ncbi:hypothetical protein [Labrys wisconsinensis]|uniref:DUF3618 domain-containing protein n=1 Tax=Labrys wisconsinensis TaxID=425677 RepID=A0ABU0J0N3_9HYPH|nr:hypothetical protein [Labrys wisconsinensis]MDQ0467830.1 hypothetical protein [Labrys wisconsinensis]